MQFYFVIRRISACVPESYRSIASRRRAPKNHLLAGFCGTGRSPHSDKGRDPDALATATAAPVSPDYSVADCAHAARPRKLIMKIIVPLLLTFTALRAAQQLSADVVQWTFADTSGQTTTAGIYTNYSASVLSRGNNNGMGTFIGNVSPSTGYPSASGTNNAGAATVDGALDPAASTYFQSKPPAFRSANAAPARGQL